MQRTKLFAVAIATLVGLASGLVLFTGGATAAQWHAYEGDIFPGHAYGLDVPEGAEAFEIAYTGEGAARFAVFGPDGAIVGHYTLGESPAAATFARPAEGRHVLYVYDVAQGALNVRVSAEEAPELKLVKVPVAREDIVLTRIDAPQRLDQLITANLEATPVFVTLLYQGRAENLDATVSSAKGAVVTVEDESGTAFSPGVWASQTGERSSDFANLAAGAYTVTATADSFEGTLVLTALTLDLAREIPVDEDMPVPVPPVTPTDLALFELPKGEPLAVFLSAGTLVVADGAHLKAATDEAEAKDEHHSHRHTSYAPGLVLVYTPEDELLGVIQTSREEPVVTLDLPVEGEYVLYTSAAGSKGLFAKLEGAIEAPPMRVLETSEVIHGFYADTMLGMGQSFDFGLEDIPLAMDLRSSGLAVGQYARVENANGVVASTDSTTILGAARMSSWSYSDPLLFAAGLHTLFVDGLVGSTEIEVRTLHYLREVTEEVVPEEVVETPAEGDEDGEPEEGDAGWSIPGMGIALPRFPVFDLPRL